jgi:hypothetical protein
LHLPTGGNAKSPGGALDASPKSYKARDRESSWFSDLEVSCSVSNSNRLSSGAAETLLAAAVITGVVASAEEALVTTAVAYASGVSLIVRTMAGRT